MLSAPHQVPQLHSRLGPTQTLTGNLGFRSAVITKLGTYTARNAHLSARVISSYDHKWFPVVKKTQETYGEKNCQTYGYSLSSSQKSNWKLEKEFGFSLLILVLLFEINGFFSLYFQYLQRNYPLRCSISRKVSNTFISIWKVFFFLFSQTQTSHPSFLIIAFSFLCWNILWKWKNQCCQISSASEERKCNSWHQDLNSAGF